MWQGSCRAEGEVVKKLYNRLCKVSVVIGQKDEGNNDRLLQKVYLQR